MRERFRAWAESLETFFLEVVFEERRDFKAGLTRGILFGGSKVFTVIVKLRRWLYNVRLLRDKTLGVQVIAIGNLTLGGTGNTLSGTETATGGVTVHVARPLARVASALEPLPVAQVAGAISEPDELKKLKLTVPGVVSPAGTPVTWAAIWIAVP